MKNILIDMLHNNKTDTQIYQYLLNNPSEDVDNQDMKNNTLLILCASRKYIESLTKLLEMGANPNLANIWGFTPICWASNDGFMDMIKVLFQYKADILHKDEKGHTPALIAIKNNRMEAAKFLLDKTNKQDDLVYFKNKTQEIMAMEDLREKEKGRRFLFALTQENFLDIMNYTDKKINSS